MRVGLGKFMRSIVPPQARAKLRRSGMVNWTLRRLFGGPQARPHPQAPYTFHFDGYRNIGWTLALTEWERDEMSFVRELHRRIPWRCAWDVGANIGCWSLFAAGLEPAVERIICFEPDAENLRWLRRNKEENRLDRMQIRELALSSEPGEATFHADPMTGSTGSLEGGGSFIRDYYNATTVDVVVPVSTLDAEMAAGVPEPDFIKLDVEGHELDVLRGGRKLLENGRPSLILEVTRNESALTALLRDLDYRLIDVKLRRWIEQAQFSTVAVHRSVEPRLSGLVSP